MTTSDITIGGPADLSQIDITPPGAGEIVRLADACRRTGHEFLFEIITGNRGKAAAPDQVLALMRRFYDLGVMPDWWKLEPIEDAAFWRAAGDIVRANDPHIQGIIVLGKEMPDDQLARVFGLSQPEPLVRGFAIGRTIFNDAAQAWFAGKTDDAGAQKMMMAVYERLIAAWDNAA